MQLTSIVKIQHWLKINPWDAMLMPAVGIAGLWSGLRARVIILDDAMITFRVAENLAHGHGFVYNVGERVQVTTTPLYAMVLAGGTWLFGAAPQAALLINLALAMLIPMLAYDVGRRLAGRITGVGAALLLTVMPLLIIAFSMESYLYVTLILASLDAYIAGRYRLAGVLVGITALVRGDAVLMGASMLTYDFLAQIWAAQVRTAQVWTAQVWTAHRHLRRRLIIPAIGIPACWYLWATLYYGSPFPATLQAKTAQGEFNWLGDYFLSGFLGYWQTWTEDYSALFYLFPVLIILGLGCAIRAERPWLIMVARDILYVFAFMGLGVTFARWYYAPVMPGVALLTARGVQLVADTLAGLIIQVLDKSTKFISHQAPLNRTNSTLRQSIFSTTVAVVIITTLLATLYPVTSDIIAANPDWKARVYSAAAGWIVKNTNSSANLATIDIGHLGYWSGRHIIDIVGLAQPDVAPHIAQGDFGYALSHYKPDMVLIGASWLPEIQSRDWFQAAYTPRHALKLDGLAEPLILFTRLEGVKVQGHPIPQTEIQSLNVDFNKQITLAGYHVNKSILPGNLLHLTLFWQVEAPIEVDFTVFVQLVDANNTILAQGDNKPQRGFYPTPYWQPGEQVVDTHTLPIKPDITPGSYDILLGFYELNTGHRLQILDKTGTFKSDHVRLSGIQIQSP